MDTRNNNEDFAITPYLFGVKYISDFKIKVFGIGICWGYYSFYIGIGFHVPKEYSGFRIINPNKE